VSIDNGPYSLLFENTLDTSAFLVPDVGRTFSFYSIAVDNVGHREQPPMQPDAVTQVLRFHNFVKSLDVSGDGIINPFDAALVVSFLVRNGSSEPSRSPPPYYDTVAPFNLITPLDALAVLSHIIRHGSGEGENDASPPIVQEQRPSPWIDTNPRPRVSNSVNAERPQARPTGDVVFKQMLAPKAKIEAGEWLDSLAADRPQFADDAPSDLSLLEWLDEDDDLIVFN
jgi:hypothetical protein